MPNQILQVDENMLETKLDRLVSEKVEQLLNAMLDAEADEITGACRRSYTLECKTNGGQTRARGRAPRPRGSATRVARRRACTSGCAATGARGYWD